MNEERRKREDEDQKPICGFEFHVCALTSPTTQLFFFKNGGGVTYLGDHI